MRSEKKKFITITRVGDESIFSKDVGMIRLLLGNVIIGKVQLLT